MLKYSLAIQLTMKYGMNSRPTSSLRHINEINHKRGLTHFEKLFWSLTHFGNKTARKKVDFLLMKKGIHTVNLQSKNKYMPPYYFLLYIQYEFM